MDSFLSRIALGVLLTVGGFSPVVVAEMDELAVDEPLLVSEKRNVRPPDLLVVDRNYDLWADPRVRLVDTAGLVLVDGALHWVVKPDANGVTRHVPPMKDGERATQPMATAPTTRPSGK
jgi:hypothetical protein